MSPEKLKALKDMQVEVAMVRTFLLEEKSNLKFTIERNYGGDKYDFQGKLDTVCELLKYIERVHSYFMGVVKENECTAIGN